MRKIYLSIITVFLLNYAFSQTIKKDSLQSLLKIEYNIFGSGLNYEAPIAKKLTLDSGTGLTLGYTVDNGFNNIKNLKDLKEWVANPCLYLKSELKYYYNFNDKIENFNTKTKKRFTKGYKGFTKGYNSGSYFAFQTKFTTDRLFDKEDKLSKVILKEIQWGVQRKLFKNFIFNFHLGIGHANDITTKQNSFYVASGLKFSYILSKHNFLK
jgi:hypothetical protein